MNTVSWFLILVILLLLVLMIVLLATNGGSKGGEGEEEEDGIIVEGMIEKEEFQPKSKEEEPEILAYGKESPDGYVDVLTAVEEEKVEKSDGEKSN